MTVSTIRPDGVVSNTGAVTGAANATVATNDNLDTSYVTLDPGESLEVTLGDFTLPANSRVISLTPKVRWSGGRGAQGRVTLKNAVSPNEAIEQGVGQYVPVTTAAFVYDGPQDLAEANADAATILIENTSPGSVTLVIYEIYLDVTYVPLPTVVVDAPTGTITDDDTPRVGWTPTLGVGGGIQTHYEVKIFDTATFSGVGFDPDTSTPDTTSGIVEGSDLEWFPTDLLANDTYRAYVRIAQTIGGNKYWSDWALSNFVQNVVAPNSPASITVTAESLLGRVKVEWTAPTGSSVIADWYELQRSSDGGTTWEDVRTEDSEDGTYYPIYVAARSGQADSADATSHSIPLPAPADGIQEGDILLAIAAFDGNPSVAWPAGWIEISDSAGAGSAVRMATAYKVAAGGESGSITVTTSASEGGGVQIFCIRKAMASQAPGQGSPSNGTGTAPDPPVHNPGGWGTENALWIIAVGYDDDISATAGDSTYYHLTNTRWANAAGAGVATKYKRAYVQQEDPGVWTLTASQEYRTFVIAVRPEKPNPVVYDYEGGNEQPVLYRIRSVHLFSSGSTSKSTWRTSSSISWLSSAWWLKHPFDSSLSMSVRIRSQPGKSKSGRVGLHQPLGREDVVAVQDTNESWSGDIAVRIDTDSDRDSLFALLDDAVPILVQAPSTAYNWEDKWIVVTGISDDRVVDTDQRPWSFVNLSWTEVERPVGAITA